MVSEEEIKYSFKKLLQRPGRSLLTVFSILLGIAAIFIFVSFGLGLYGYVNQFASSGAADKITITPKGMGAPGLSEQFSLTNSDIRAIENTPGVFEVSAMYAKAAEIQQDKIKKYVFSMGLDANKPLIFEITNTGLYKGRWLQEGDSGKVILGYNYLVKDRIFPKVYDLNDKITIQGKEFRIVGFIDPIGNPQDDSQIYMTTNSMEELYGNNLTGYGYVIAKVDSTNIKSVISRVEDNLRRSRNIEKGKEDFFVQSWEELLATYSNVLNGIIGFIVLIAFISVIVSAINTANTMITSVLERIREIGVMKAVGARNSEIFNIFLFESALLGFSAGVCGVGLGWIFTSAIAKLLINLGWGFLQPQYSISLFAVLIFFATLTGAISGALPAYKASRISPVVALRYE